jgi:hypothetical protein
VLGDVALPAGTWAIPVYGLLLGGMSAAWYGRMRDLTYRPQRWWAAVALACFIAAGVVDALGPHN